MRILVLTNLYPPHGVGGYEERCRQVCESLAAMGHTVEILCSDFHKQGGAAEGPLPVSRRLRLNGYLDRPWLPLRRVWALERHNHALLAESLARVRPDLVHVWNMGGLGKSLLHRLERSGLPVVYDVSDHWLAASLRRDVWLSWWNAETASGAARFARGLLTALGLRALLDRGIPTASWDKLRWERIYFCSAFLRQLSADAGYPVTHGAVIPCGVDAARHAIKQDYAPPRRFLWVGRLHPDKDPATAIRALAKLGLPDATLSLYGGGEPAMRAELVALADSLGLSERVAFRQATHGEMASVYAAHDALLFTSHWGEPFALTPLEAMASALPVILSPDGGGAELLREGDNAFGFTPGDADSLAVAIGRLLASPDFGRAMAARAREDVLRRYDKGVMVRSIADYLRASLSTP